MTPPSCLQIAKLFALILPLTLIWIAVIIILQLVSATIREHCANFEVMSSA